MKNLIIIAIIFTLGMIFLVNSASAQREEIGSYSGRGIILKVSTETVEIKVPSPTGGYEPASFSRFVLEVCNLQEENPVVLQVEHNRLSNISQNGENFSVSYGDVRRLTFLGHPSNSMEGEEVFIDLDGCSSTRDGLLLSISPTGVIIEE